MVRLPGIAEIPSLKWAVSEAKVLAGVRAPFFMWRNLGRKVCDNITEELLAQVCERTGLRFKVRAAHGPRRAVALEAPLSHPDEVRRTLANAMNQHLFITISRDRDKLLVTAFS